VVARRVIEAPVGPCDACVHDARGRRAGRVVDAVGIAVPRKERSRLKAHLPFSVQIAFAAGKSNGNLAVAEVEGCWVVPLKGVSQPLSWQATPEIPKSSRHTVSGLLLRKREETPVCPRTDISVASFGRHRG
jgi:hypothetical protein